MAEKEMGIKKEMAGALAYVLGPVTGIFFLVTSKDPFVRFHAMQSTVTSIVFMVILRIFGFILFFISGLIGLAGFALWLILIYKAWQGDEWEVPVLGKIAKNLLKKI